MATVQAIRSVSGSEQVAELLLKHYGTLHSDIWRLGVNIALRITDMLNLTQAELRIALDKGTLRIKEGKTGKYRVLELNVKAREIINNRLEENPVDTFIFQSTSNRASAERPITRQSVYKAFRAIGHIVKVDLGTHSMRKTRGCILYYQEGVPIEEICKMLNHSNPSVTMVYLGITQEQINKTYRYEI